MTTDDLIAHHVEALVSLGWRWEGRGLVPGGEHRWPLLQGLSEASEAGVMEAQAMEAS